MTSFEIREKFIEFFKEKGHKVIPSASLVPEDVTEADKTLFTSAGMQQFKKFYTEPSETPYSRVATSQKCIRTGDIDEVGDDTHLTFFEMMGNFSFGYPSKKGSYFKEEVIKFAWEFLTDVLRVDKERIHATFFDSTLSKNNKDVLTDTESKELLEKINGLEKIVAQGDDNFWSLGSENSPGGPTVEFYIDNIEIWNLVFNEYVLKNGKYETAEFKGVDTGMGLERLTTVINGFDNVYETDLFQSIIKKIEEISGKKYEEYRQSFRIITDHIKAAVFAISDGIVPSNKEAGYIVRRLIRRAIIKGQQHGIKENFTGKLADVVFKIYDRIYYFSSESEKPSNSSRQFSNNKNIIMELEREEIKFKKTLKDGLTKIDSMSDMWLGEIKNGKIIEEKYNATADDIFDLYQSHGFPIELSLELMAKKGVFSEEEKINQAKVLIRIEEKLKAHQELSRTASAGMFKGGMAEAGEMTTKYHTATHLLLAALQKLIDPNIVQRGSNITAERLRFDFNHPEKLSAEQIEKVEDLVNEQIEKDLQISMEETTLDEAKKSGAKGIFENKYGEKVKVYTIGDPTNPFSKEICGGPHVNHTSELGKFRIQKEESSSAGVRRIKGMLE